MLRAFNPRPTQLKRFQTLQGLIIKATQGLLKPDEYNHLVYELNPANLRLTHDGKSLLYWVIDLALINPRLFIDVWFNHNDKLTIVDFRSKALGKEASPHWLLAMLSGIYPQIYLAFFMRFKNHFILDDIKDHIIHEDGKITSIFGLLAMGATKNPEPFNIMWNTFCTQIKGEMLVNPKESIDNQPLPPFISIHNATQIGKLKLNVIHFCFQQLGDLRVAMPPIEYCGHIIVPQNNPAECQLVSVPLMLSWKNEFFDRLAQFQNNPEFEDSVNQAAENATKYGFYNAYIHLAAFYKSIGQFGLSYQLLTKVPAQSIFCQIAMKTAIQWMMSQVLQKIPNKTRKKYLYACFRAACKLDDPSLRNNTLRDITYCSLIEGKRRPADHNGFLSDAMLSVIHTSTDPKTYLERLRTGNAAVRSAFAEDNTNESLLDPLVGFMPAFSTASIVNGAKLNESEDPILERDIPCWLSR